MQLFKQISNLTIRVQRTRFPNSWGGQSNIELGFLLYKSSLVDSIY